MTALSEKVVDMVNEMDGFTNATNGLGSGDATINLQIDRDKVRSYGLTVAQVYQQIAAKLTTTTTAQTPRCHRWLHHDVQISNNLDPLTKENMMDMTFETTVMSADGTTATGTCKLSDIASWTTGTAPDAITSENQTEFVTVTADTTGWLQTPWCSPACCRRSWTSTQPAAKCRRAAASRWAARPRAPTTW